MNKKIIPFVILLLGLSLLGIVGFQVYWINHALQVKRGQFDQDVTEALNKVAEKLETHEAVDVISDQMKTLHLTKAPLTPLKPKLQISAANPAPRVPVGIPEKKNTWQHPVLIKADSLYIIDQRVAAARPDRRPATTWRSVQRSNASTIDAVYETTHFQERVAMDTTLHKLIRLHAAADTFRIKDKIGRTFVHVASDTNTKFFFRLDTLNPALIKSIVVSQKNTLPASKIDSFNRQVIKINGKNGLVLPARGASSYSFSQVLPDNQAPVIFRKGPLPAKQTLSYEAVAIVNSQVKKSPKKTEYILAKQKKVEAKAEKITEVIQKMAEGYVLKDLPLEKRVSKSVIDSLLKQQLHDRGIFLPYDYALVTDKKNATTHFQTVGFKPDYIADSHQVRLFPNDIYTKSHFLSLHFYNEGAYVLHSMKYLMGASLLFTCIILTTFLITIYTLIKQKKISDIKNDFINNMTHEFKTPLATISLAIDSINNPKVLDNKDRIQHYAGIIRDENKRMHTQVENVLQMALLDKEQLKLNKKQVNIHSLICQAIQNMNLHIEARAGSITANMGAQHPNVYGDEAHLGNIICNLLDNANKYSPAKPEIFISTTNTSAGLVIAVEDKGMGMSKDTQKRIFDKFYRVSTGNIHNVKGFGLGLSYVKAIMLAHKGSVAVKSELGAGSRFELIFPGPKTL